MLIIGKNHITITLKIFWLCMVFLILVITLSFFDGQKNSDIEDFLIYSMLLLTFPSGIIFTGIAFIILYMLTFFIEEMVLNVGYIYLTIEWLFLVLVGYIQWFLLIPIIYKKYKD
ncbi:hypothetical protein, partial [Enterobacter cloacae]|uniref:hypothetical protein n=1 Tax=Enterobacter cloacae TaxID=550 RepID=UPI002A81B214